MVAVPDVCVLTFKDVNVDHRIDCSNFPEEIPRLQEIEPKPMRQESLSNRFLAEIYVLKDLMYPEKDDVHLLEEAAKVWRKAGEDEKAQFGIKYRREIEILSIDNDLREAIRAGDTGEAKRRLNELTERNSEHKILHPVTVLIEALNTARPHDPVTALAYLDRLCQEWAPAAETVFRKEAKALLAPFWRAVGQALESMSFDPDNPDRHASRAYLECGDWEAVVRVVQAERKFENQPILLERMAESLWRIDQGMQAIASWFILCWQAPKYFEQLIESGHILDSSLLEYWNEAMDIYMEPDEPEISVEWFPAWVLLCDPRWARSIKSCGAEVGPQRAFDLVRELMMSDDEQLALRQELRKIHPALFRCFLQLHR